MNPNIEDRVAFLERWNERLEDELEAQVSAADAAVKSLEYADFIILGCIICLTVLAFYAAKTRVAS